MRRTHRRSLSRSTSKRRMHWESSHVWGIDANIAIDPSGALDFVTAWVKWPAGIADFSESSFPFPYVAAEDQTVSRLHVNFDWMDTGNGDGFSSATDAHAYFLSAGIIAWEVNANLADLLEANILAGDELGIPDPYHAGFPWYWRYSQGVNVRGANFAFGAPLDQTLRSVRSQRKLRPGTGLLFVMTCRDQASAPSTDVSLAFEFDCRLLVKDV